MPRKLPTRTTLNNHLRQAIYTQAGLAADPRARDFLPMTEAWEGRVKDKPGTEGFRLFFRNLR